MAQEQETLDMTATPLEVIRREAPLDETEARSFLHYFLFGGDEVFVPVHRLSYGERSRLMLAVLAVQGCNFLILDEPINHLDIPSRERFERAVARFQGTVLAVVHDRYFIERVATAVWTLEGEQVRVDRG
jgi:ATP-binding cassette, subfamily F, member 3